MQPTSASKIQDAKFLEFKSQLNDLAQQTGWNGYLVVDNKEMLKQTSCLFSLVEKMKGMVHLENQTESDHIEKAVSNFLIDHFADIQDEEIVKLVIALAKKAGLIPSNDSASDTELMNEIMKAALKKADEKTLTNLKNRFIHQIKSGETGKNAPLPFHLTIPLMHEMYAKHIALQNKNDTEEDAGETHARDEDAPAGMNDSQTASEEEAGTQQEDQLTKQTAASAAIKAAKMKAATGELVIPIVESPNPNTTDASTLFIPDLQPEEDTNSPTNPNSNEEILVVDEEAVTFNTKEKPNAAQAETKADKPIQFKAKEIKLEKSGNWSDSLTPLKIAKFVATVGLLTGFAIWLSQFTGNKSQGITPGCNISNYDPITQSARYPFPKKPDINFTWATSRNDKGLNNLPKKPTQIFKINNTNVGETTKPTETSDTSNSTLPIPISGFVTSGQYLPTTELRASQFDQPDNSQSATLITDAIYANDENNPCITGVNLTSINLINSTLPKPKFGPVFPSQYQFDPQASDAISITINSDTCNIDSTFPTIGKINQAFSILSLGANPPGRDQPEVQTPRWSNLNFTEKNNGTEKAVYSLLEYPNSSLSSSLEVNQNQHPFNTIKPNSFNSQKSVSEMGEEENKTLGIGLGKLLGGAASVFVLIGAIVKISKMLLNRKTQSSPTTFDDAMRYLENTDLLPKESASKRRSIKKYLTKNQTPPQQMIKYISPEGPEPIKKSHRKIFACYYPSCLGSEDSYAKKILTAVYDDSIKNKGIVASIKIVEECIKKPSTASDKIIIQHFENIKNFFMPNAIIHRKDKPINILMSLVGFLKQCKDNRPLPVCKDVCERFKNELLITDPFLAAIGQIPEPIQDPDIVTALIDPFYHDVFAEWQQISKMPHLIKESDVYKSLQKKGTVANTLNSYITSQIKIRLLSGIDDCTKIDENFVNSIITGYCFLIAADDDKNKQNFLGSAYDYYTKKQQFDNAQKIAIQCIRRHSVIGDRIILNIYKKFKAPYTNPNAANTSIQNSKDATVPFLIFLRECAYQTQHPACIECIDDFKQTILPSKAFNSIFYKNIEDIRTSNVAIRQSIKKELKFKKTELDKKIVENDNEIRKRTALRAFLEGIVLNERPETNSGSTKIKTCPRAYLKDYDPNLAFKDLSELKSNDPLSLELMRNFPMDDSRRKNIIVEIPNFGHLKKGDEHTCVLTEENFEHILELAHYYTIDRPYPIDNINGYFIDWQNRTGHDGTHSARQVRHLEMLIDLCAQHGKPEVRKLVSGISTEEKLSLVLAAYLLRSGRVDESNFDNNGGYNTEVENGADTYRERSWEIYEKYAEELCINKKTTEWIKLLVLKSYLPEELCDKIICKTEITKLEVFHTMFYLIHELDDIRHNDFEREDIKGSIVHSCAYLLPEGDLNNYVNKLFDFAVLLCHATGLIIKTEGQVDHNPIDHPDSFEILKKLSHDAKLCREILRSQENPDWTSQIIMTNGRISFYDETGYNAYAAVDKIIGRGKSQRDLKPYIAPVRRKKNSKNTDSQNETKKPIDKPSSPANNVSKDPKNSIETETEDSNDSSILRLEPAKS